MTKEIKIMVKNSSTTWVEEAVEDIKGATVTYVDGCDDLGVEFLVTYDNEETLKKVYEAINEIGTVQEDYAVVEVLELHEGTVELDEEDIEIVDEVKLKVTHNNKCYYVYCYYVGDYTSDSSDTYSIRVYDNYESLNSTRDEIADMYVFSDGSSIADEGLHLKDEVVEEAVMEALFGVNSNYDGILYAF